MKRSPGSPLGGGAAKRFEKMRSGPQMHMQQHYHQQIQQQQHQQHQQHQQQQQQQHQQHSASAVAAAFSANSVYYPGIQTPPPNMNIMPPQYGRVPAPPNAYLYNNNNNNNLNLAPTLPPSGNMNMPPMPPRMWNYNVPPPLPPPTIAARQPSLIPSQRGPVVNNHNHKLPAQSHISAAPLPFPKDSDYPSTSKQALLSLADATGADEELQTIVNRKSKRKSMSSRYGATKNWVREDALRVIALEEEYSRRHTKAPILLLRFPDPDLNRDIIAKYTPAIESVHFQQNSAPRYCFVHLKEDADVEATIETISKIPFGTGFISAELKRIPVTEPAPSPRPDDVDPYTLYVGNLPTTISSVSVKQHFPGAHRIDIGFAQRMKYTRYAFVRYDTVEEAMEAFRRSVNTLIETRSLIVRFRRERSTMPKDGNSAAASATAAAVAVELKGDDRTTMLLNGDSADDATANRKLNPEPTQNASTMAPPPPSPPPTSSPPTSLDKPDINEDNDVDSKDNDASLQLAKENELLQQQQIANRRSSLEEMFGALERCEASLADLNNSAVAATAGGRLASSVCIKDENLSEDEELPANNLLGERYKENAQVKTEPEEEQPPKLPAAAAETANKSTAGNQTPTRDEIYPDDFQYDQDNFDTEPEEEDEGSTFGTCIKNKKNSSAKPMGITALSKCNDAGSWEALRQRELTAASEEKPNVTQLPATHVNNIGGAGGKTPPSDHSLFVKELYAQVRRSKEAGKAKRPRDEFGSLFAQLESDESEDEDLF